jgi:hypothetical protein
MTQPVVVHEEFPQLGVRIPRSLLNRLQAASLARKQAKALPKTQAQIVAVAITAWLDEEGF